MSIPVLPQTTVSIVTITQLPRNNSLKLLADMIQEQLYEPIIEWVIVEGSRTLEDANKNYDFIKEIQTTMKIPIVYVPYININNKLSDLRNLGNDTCKGEIIVCMDDDDYYPPERVCHTVKRLTKSKYLIAGCSDMYIFDFLLHKQYRYRKFHANHSTNNCMAYKKEYLINHRYLSNLDFAEEAGFTNQFSEKMVQLNPKKCIVTTSHDTNTFNKRDIHINNKQQTCLYEISKIRIPEHYLQKMTCIFQKRLSFSNITKISPR